MDIERNDDIRIEGAVLIQPVENDRSRSVRSGEMGRGAPEHNIPLFLLRKHPPVIVGRSLRGIFGLLPICESQGSADGRL